MAIRLARALTGKVRSALKGHKGRVTSLAFSPDAKTIASGSEDGGVKLWDLAKEKEQATLSEGGRDFWSVLFSPDGKTLAGTRAERTPSSLSRCWFVPPRNDSATATSPSAGHARTWEEAIPSRIYAASMANISGRETRYCSRRVAVGLDDFQDAMEGVIKRE